MIWVGTSLQDHQVQSSIQHCQGHIYTSYRDLHLCSVQPVPVLCNPLREEISPLVQFKLLLAQLSFSVACYMGEETNPHPAH